MPEPSARDGGGRRQDPRARGVNRSPSLAESPCAWVASDGGPPCPSLKARDGGGRRQDPRARGFGLVAADRARARRLSWRASERVNPPGRVRYRLHSRDGGVSANPLSRSRPQSAGDRHDLARALGGQGARSRCRDPGRRRRRWQPEGQAPALAEARRPALRTGWLRRLSGWNRPEASGGQRDAPARAAPFPRDLPQVVLEVDLDRVPLRGHVAALHLRLGQGHVSGHRGPVGQAAIA